MKKLLLILLLPALVGCNFLNNEEPKISEQAPTGGLTWEIIENKTDIYESSYPRLITGPAAMVASLNTDLPSGIESFAKQAENWKLAVEADPEVDFWAPWMLHIEPGYQYQDDTFVSLRLDTYDYTGGAHGNGYYGVMNYHVPTASFVALEDLFVGEEHLETLSAFLRAEIALEKASREEFYEDYSATEDSFLIEGTAPDRKNFKTFVFEDGPEGRGLQFSFAPYQVGIYAEGSFNVLVPVGILAEFVKEDYKYWFETVPTDVADYVGLDTDQATALAESRGVRFRVVEADGQPLPATKDYRPGRINATTEAGFVINYQTEGEN